MSACPDSGAARDFAAGFASALAGSGAPVGLGKRGGRPDAGRFRIYRNNVGVALAGALASRFPVVRRLVGETCFAALAKAYGAARPPTSPVMHGYGDDLPDFLDGDGFPPVSELTYLADVARLEAAISAAYHAAEAPVADLALLAAFATPGLDRARLHPHPATRVLASEHPIGTIWSAHQAQTVCPVEDWRGETVLVTRPQADVRLTILPAGDAPFALAVLNAVPIGVAAETHPATPDIGKALVALFQLGAVETVSLSEAQE